MGTAVRRAGRRPDPHGLRGMVPGAGAGAGQPRRDGRVPGRQQEAYYEALVPEALELMHGIADGAAGELASSAFPHQLSHFHKILMINSYFGLMGKPPVSDTARHVPPEDEVHACSGAVILGGATKDGRTIHVSSEDQHFFPQEYLVTFVANPSDRRAHRFTVTDSAGEIGSEHAQNDRGVTVSGYAGGSVGVLGPTRRRPVLRIPAGRPGLAGGRLLRGGVRRQREARGGAADGRPAVVSREVGQQDRHREMHARRQLGRSPTASSGFVVESIPADQQGICAVRHAQAGRHGREEEPATSSRRTTSRRRTATTSRTSTTRIIRCASTATPPSTRPTSG